MKKKYNHAFSIAFSLDSDNEGEYVTEREILIALNKRIANLIEHDEILEAVGLPFDTYENYEN